MPYLHRICRIWRRLSFYLLRALSMQSILWMQTNFNKNKYKTNIMEGQIDLMAKVYFWFDWCQQGQYITLIIHLLTISPEKNTMHQVVVSNGKKMIQAQFISSWWHWLQVFNWKGGNEDPNRKVVLRENKWHYVVILLKRNKTKTSLNTWGFQQKKEGKWKAQCLNFCVLWAGGLRQQKDALTISYSISLSKILVQKKNFDNTWWWVQMYRSANDFFMKDKRGTDLTKKSSKMSDYQQTARYKIWMS